MRSGSALALAIIAAAPPALHACSCASYEPFKACQLYHTSPVIVRARIADHNHQRRGTLDQITLYRFDIIEAFKGLAPEIKQINPASGTSCYTEFSEGIDYLFYLSNPDRLPRPSIALLDQPLPTAWTPALLSSLPQFFVGVCDPARQVTQPATDPDLVYLREARSFTPNTPGWIEGRAVLLQLVTRVSELLPAPGVTVQIASDHLRVRHRVTVPADGYFRSPPLMPGLYSITPHSNVLGPALQAARNQEQVFPGGCVVANALFATRATISGKVLDAEGKPAPAVRVETAELNLHDKIHGPTRTLACTSADGSFLLEEVPVGPVVVGVNLKGAPTQRAPYDSVAAPGPINIKPGEARTGVIIKLPPPLPFGNLEVEVLWPDGTPARDTARASAHLGENRVDFSDAASGSHIVSLPIALGRTYGSRAEWHGITKSRRSVYLDPTPPQSVDFTRDGQRITIRLTEPRPRE